MVGTILIEALQAFTTSGDPMPVDMHRQIDAWRERLLDLTKRNRLVSFQWGARGAVQVVHPGPAVVWSRLIAGDTLTFPWKRTLLGLNDADEDEDDSGDELLQSDALERAATRDRPSDLKTCLESGRVGPDDLLTDLTDSVLRSRLHRLRLTSQTTLSERGVHTLYMAFGVLRWYESDDSDRPVHSPLLLVPVNLERKHVDSPPRVRLYEDEVSSNFTLGQLLRTSFRLEWPDLSEVEDLEAERARYFARVTEAIAPWPRWKVVDLAAIGSFSFQKLAMWRDLDQNRTRVAAHGACRIIAGDTDVSVGPDRLSVRASESDDKVPPTDLHTIRDCDGSQLDAILAVKAGTSLVLDGPPGTGKSQTIANIIAEFLAEQRTVLFVSEKAAALEVVKRRLDERNLGDFVLECHSHKANKQTVVAELGRCLVLEPESYRDQTAQLERLADVRRRLTAYVRALHRRRGALGITPYQAHGRVSALRADAVTRCPITAPLEVDGARLRRMCDAIEALQRRGAVVALHDRHPWRGTTLRQISLTGKDELAHDLRQVAEKARALEQAGNTLLDLGFLQHGLTAGNVEATLGATRAALGAPRVPPVWFRVNPPQAAAKAALSVSRLAEQHADLLDALSEYRPDAPGRWTKDLVGSLGASSEDALARLPGASATVRGRLGELRAAQERLKQLREVTAAARTALRRLGELLDQPVEDMSARRARSLVLVGQAASRTSVRVVRTWFEEATRARVSAVARRCGDQLRQAGKVRAALEAAGLANGFDGAGPALAAECENFESFWSRLFSFRWGKVRRSAQALFDRSVATADMLRVMAELRRLGQLHADVKREAEAAGSDLPAGLATLEEDTWRSVLEDLEAVDLMVGTGLVNSSLREALLRPGQLDRAAVATATERLSSALEQVRLAVLDATEVFDLESVGSDARPAELCGLDELVRWLEGVIAAVGERTRAHEAWCALLTDGADVTIDGLGSDDQALANAKAAGEELEKLLERTKSILPMTDAARARRWRTEADAARWLLELIAERGSPPPSPWVALVTSDEFRLRLGDAVTHAERARAAFMEVWPLLQRTFETDRPVSTGLVLRDTELARLADWSEERAQDVGLLQDWIELQQVLEDLNHLGLRTLSAEVLRSELPVAEAHDAFLKRFYRLWLDAAYKADEVLLRFRPDDHDNLVEEFRQLDRESVENGFKRIRTRLLSAQSRPRVDAVTPPTSESGILSRETAKKRRQLPLRELFRRIPRLLQQLKPCVMMSPLSVSTYLDTPEIGFDLVIFDEASQVRPQDAIGAIYRGRQLVVAGDQRQLPPASFFELGGDEGDEEDPDEERVSDFESILDLCCTRGLPRKRLIWHYRSRRESLIAFSNHHIYDGELITFPSVQDTDGTHAVRLVNVPEGRWRTGGSGGRNPVEARRVAELIMEHARRRPDQSLGVVAFNQQQQLIILSELEKLRKRQPELEEFFDEERPEPFFVKNLENVQGDERNVIMISVGYARDDATRAPKKTIFGFLNRKGGERRLNVLVTRATHEIVVVASIRSVDIDAGGESSRGLQLLRAYLDYAEHGVGSLTSLAREGPRGESESVFEEEVWRALRDQGLDVRKQVGCSGFRIDLGIVHPEQKGRFVLGVECDGASYHSSVTARDRDRLRQQVLESLGWRIVRIWSTDWVRGPGRQLERVKQAYEAALALPASMSPPGPPASAKSVEEPLRTASSPPEAPPRRYRNIDEVPAAALTTAILESLRSYGATPQAELVRAAARRLGFDRTGTKIRERIQREIDRLLLGGSIHHNDSGAVAIG